MKPRDTLTVEIPRPTTRGPLRVLVQAPSGLRKLRLPPGGALVLGSSEEADVTVEDRHVSAVHCRLSFRERISIEDLGSRNGVFVLGGRVERAELVGERPEFRIGETTIRLEPLENEEIGLGLVGKSEPMERLREAIRRYARTSAPILILGESGTGKDLVARALHAESRRSGEYVALNVATLPDTLIDAELFGHTKGSFTGALADRPGAFELADHGTLFLDEIAELSPSAQAKLLRVVEEKIVRPVGGRAPISVSSRVVAATCLDLAAKVRREEFRLDLFHRLGTLIIEVPSLRRRASDIPLLVREFLRKKRDELGERVVDERALRYLAELPWPGNVRELFAVVYRAALHSSAPLLSIGDFSSPSMFGTNAPTTTFGVDEARNLVKEAGNVSAAARRAGLPRSTFRDLLKEGPAAKRVR